MHEDEQIISQKCSFEEKYYWNIEKHYCKLLEISIDVFRRCCLVVTVLIKIYCKFPRTLAYRFSGRWTCKNMKKLNLKIAILNINFVLWWTFAFMYSSCWGYIKTSPIISCESTVPFILKLRLVYNQRMTLQWRTRSILSKTTRKPHIYNLLYKIIVIISLMP